jgi:hypothetical protein
MAKSQDYEVAFPGRFIHAADFLGKQVTLTIADVKLEKMPNEKKNGGQKWIVSFEKTEKEWALNRTNAEALVCMWGRDISKWVGKRVTLFPREVESFGETVPAIRVAGSPDLDAPKSITIPRGKLKITVNVVPTKAAKPVAAVKAAVAEPESDESFLESGANG